MDDLGRHVAGEGEGGGGEGGRRRGHRLAPQEEIHAEGGHVVGDGQVEGPGLEGGQHGQQPGGRVGGTGIEPAEQGRAAEQVGIEEGQGAVPEVVGDQHPQREVLDEIVTVDEGTPQRLRQRGTAAGARRGRPPCPGWARAHAAAGRHHRSGWARAGPAPAGGAPSPADVSAVPCATCHRAVRAGARSTRTSAGPEAARRRSSRPAQKAMTAKSTMRMATALWPTSA